MERRGSIILFPAPKPDIYRRLSEHKTCGLTTLYKPKARELSTYDGIITQNISNSAVPTSS